LATMAAIMVALSFFLIIYAFFRQSIS
jgi:hypothetical protein